MARVRKTPEKRRGWNALTPTGKAVAIATPIAVAGAVAGGVVLHNRSKPANVARRAETPAMVQEARAGDFHDYDRMAVERKLKKTSPTITKHWDKITRVAGTNYNTLAVIDTLSRAPGGLNELGPELREQQNAGTAQASRKIDILRRVQDLAAKDKEGTEAMLGDLYGIRSRDVEVVRHTYYGKTRGNWQYGRLISGSHTNAPQASVPKDRKLKQLDPKSARLKAKARNSR